MGMMAILVMWPSSFEQTFIPPSYTISSPISLPGELKSMKSGRGMGGGGGGVQNMSRS